MVDRPLLIRGGRVIDPAQNIDEVLSLLITGDKISWLGKEDDKSLPGECDILKADGLIVSPGFIDLHCHLREPGFEDKETIITGTQAAANGGFTTICCMPNTNPPLDSRSAVKRVTAEADKNGLVRVLPIGCITQDRGGEKLSPMSELAKAGVIGFSDDGDCLMNTELMCQALRNARELGLIIIEHCEHAGLAKGGIINLGRLSLELGLTGIPAAAEEIMVARDIALARITGGRIHIAHASTAGTVDIIRRARAEGLPVTAEVTPHHLTLTEEKVRGYDTSAKVNPPLRTEEDIRALIEALKDDVIDAIATDHAPHTVGEKGLGFGEAPFGISGFETALGSLMSLVHGGQLTLDKLISKLTREPAGILGNKQEKTGSLETGFSADVVIFDPDKEWQVDPDTFASKGKNTPLAGARLKGKVMATISRGKIVYRNTALKIQASK
ncbi:MAG: dihydroorotase [Dehalococcoidales bacterium]